MALIDQTLRFDDDADLVRQIRIGRHPNSTTRVVLDAPQVRDVLSRALVARAADARLRHVVVTDVRMSPDLRLATVYYVALDEGVTRDELAIAHHEGVVECESRPGRTVFTVLLPLS